LIFLKNINSRGVVETVREICKDYTGNLKVIAVLPDLKEKGIRVG